MNRGTAAVVQLGKGVTAGSFSGLNVLTNVILGKKDAIQKDFNGLVLTDLVMLGKKISHITIITVTVGPAVSPLMLPDAIADSLKYVKAYGGIEQNGTPTPDAPVDIVCNNGVLKLKDSELPVGYKRLTGISYDTNTYYETNEKLYGSDTLTITLSNTSSSGRNVIGAYSGTGDDARNFSLFVYGADSTSNSYLRHGTKLSRPRYGDGTRTLVMGPSGTDGFLNNTTYAEEDFETTDTFWIGALPNSSSTKFDGNIVGNITVSNRLKYIPCERVSDGKIGYYETFTGTFLESQGTGTPVSMGYDTSYMTEIYADGTVETINANRDFLSRDGETVGQIINSDGTVSSNSNYAITAPCQLPAGDYTCTWNTGGGSRPFGVFECDTDGNIIPTESGGQIFYDSVAESGINTGAFTISTPKLVRVSFRRTATDLSVRLSLGTATAEMLLKVGDYADVQEILSGNITRNVGVKVFDGTEDWTTTGTNGSNNYRFSLSIDSNDNAGSSLCTHIDRIVRSSSTVQSDRPCIRFTTSGLTLGWYDTDNTTTLAQFKQFLADQYAAGTPVILVYPLAEPTTEVVAGQSLQVQEGDNTLEITQASIDGVELEAQYEQGVQASVQEIEP